MHPCIQDIESLLVLSRTLLGKPVPDVEQLQAWSVERKMLFARLENRDMIFDANNSRPAETLIAELLETDAKLCAMFIENQLHLGQQIAAARNLRRGLRRIPVSAPSRWLQRVA